MFSRSLWPELFSRSPGRDRAQLILPVQLESLKILHVLPTRDREHGGPVFVAEAMVEEARRLGATCMIFPSAEGEPKLRSFRDLRRAVASVDVVHIHGLWNIKGTLAAYFAQALHVPYFVTPHGMLDRWARSQRRIRKAVYSMLLERRSLARAAGVQFLNAEELAEAGDIAVPMNGFILPNGVFANRFADMPEKNSLRARSKEFQDKYVVLFLGRLHPKKGLDDLLPAFAGMSRVEPHAHLIVAGPGPRSYLLELKDRARQLGIGDKVEFLGMVQGARKREIFALSDVFVLPSHQEGDSVAVKEAMASGLPVIITAACHFPEIETKNAGLVISPNIKSLEEALLQIGRNRYLRVEMGKNAQKLVSEKYTWEKVVGHLLDAYRRSAMHGPAGVP